MIKAFNRLLCLFGFHDFEEIGDPEYLYRCGCERCRYCGKEEYWSNSFYG